MNAKNQLKIAKITKRLVQNEIETDEGLEALTYAQTHLKRGNVNHYELLFCLAKTMKVLAKLNEKDPLLKNFTQECVHICNGILNRTTLLALVYISIKILKNKKIMLQENILENINMAKISGRIVHIF